MWKKKNKFPNMRNVPKPSRKKDSRVLKVGNRYSLVSPQLPSTEETLNTSTPVPAHSSHSILSHTYSPIRIHPNKNGTSISYSPPEEFQSPLSPILHSPIETKKKTLAKKKKKKSKLAKVKIYHPKTTDKRKTANRAVAVSNSAEDTCDEAPLPKRRHIRENANKRRGRETEERTPGQFPCKSVKVVGGSIIDLRVIYKSESARWSKTGDINYSVGTTTEQFKWGLLEILGGGVKPTSLSKDWMVFHLMSGSIEIYLDCTLIGTLDKLGDTFVVPPDSTYEFNNLYNKKAVLTYFIIILT